MSGQASRGQEEAAGQRKRWRGPGTTCDSSQEACSATAARPERPPAPASAPGCPPPRPGPPRRQRPLGGSPLLRRK